MPPKARTDTSSERVTRLSNLTPPNYLRAVVHHSKFWCSTSEMGLVISDVLSARQPFPLWPRFQTYRCLAANDVEGQYETSSLAARRPSLAASNRANRSSNCGFQKIVSRDRLIPR